MYPVLYNSSNTKVAVLDNIIDETATITRKINGQFTFGFQAHEKELKSEYFNFEGYVAVGDKLFDIKYVQTDHNTSVVYNLDCEHVSYRLIDYELESYTYYGTPTQILTNILSGTGFTVGTVSFAGSTTFSVSQTTNKLAVILALCAHLGGEIDYTNFAISIKNTIGQNNGYEVRFGKNLIGISKIIDRRDNKVQYKVNALILKNSTEYIQNDLGNLEIVEEGDTIKVIDKVIGIDTQQRIIQRSYNPILEKNVELELANHIELITDKITQIQEQYVSQNRTYNNIRINAEEGFVSERSDDKAKTLMNATEGIAIYARDDAGNPYIKVFYVDLNGRIQATALDISGDSTFKGTLEVGTNYKIKILEEDGVGIIRFLDGESERGSLSYYGEFESLLLLSDGKLAIHSSDGDIQVMAADGLLLAAQTIARLSGNTGIELSTSGPLEVDCGIFTVNGQYIATHSFVYSRTISTDYEGNHNHGISNGVRLAVVNTDNEIIGNVGWTESGGFSHSHSIT